MKTDRPFLGVLGLGSFSTQYYLQRIHQKYQQRNQEFSTCPLLVYQVDFQQINPFLPDNFKTLKPCLESYLNEIEDLRISKVLVPNITLHETLDQIKTNLSICHAVDLTVEFLKMKKILAVTLFGTLYTMNSPYIKEKLAAEKIEINLPKKSDQHFIDAFRKKVYEGNQSDLDIRNFQELQRKYAETRPIAIACTELSIFSLKENPSVVDMAELQIEQFVNSLQS